MTGPQLKEARERAGLTQEQVGAQLGIHRVTVTRWEDPRTKLSKGKALRYMDAIAALTERAA